jgi:hypothetical protein
MKVDIPVHAISITDENSGEHKTITTVRTVAEIAGDIEETERELVEDKAREKVEEALAQSE